MPALAAERHRFVVADDEAGTRLDLLLAARVPGLSRRQARVLIDIGGVFVDRARTKVAGRPLRAGQLVEANLGGALARATPAVGKAARARDDAGAPEPTILHLDEDIVVVDKPAALITAPTPESDRHNLAHHLEVALGPPIFVVHRLDLGTSGVLVLARTDLANRALAERFRVHDVDRRYLAVVLGDLSSETCTVDRPIEGRPARTHFAVRERLGGRATLVECRLETGRTHQIRIHAAHLGHPVLGDRRHGIPRPGRHAAPPDPAPHLAAGTHPAAPQDDPAAPLPSPPRLALHAFRLAFPHPRSGEPLAFERPLPLDLATWLDALRALA